MSEERTDVDPDIADLLARRWSPRAWVDGDVEKDKLETCFEAARWAASSMNQQPWRLVVAMREQPSEHARIVGCLSEAKAVWASSAPVLMVSVAKNTFDESGKPNRFAWHDTGLATAALMVQATALGLHVHAMGGFSRDATRSNLGIPEGFEPVAAIAMGYAGRPDSLPEDLRMSEVAPRTRRPCEAWVFRGAWDQLWPGPV